MSSQRKQIEAGAILHRRETRRQIILPMLAGVLLLAIMVSSALLLPDDLQLSLVADLLLTILVLCPTALCLLPVVLLFVVMVVGMNRAHGELAGVLERAEGLSRAATDKTAQVMDSVNQTVANTGARIAPLDKMVDVFDPPQPTQTDVQKVNDDRDNTL